MTFTTEQMTKANSVTKRMYTLSNGYRPCNHDMAEAFQKEMPELTYEQALELNTAQCEAE